jgi:hypothetical protein
MKSEKELLLKKLLATRADLKLRAGQGDEEAANQLAMLRNIDKLRKRYDRAKKAYELAKQQLV